MNALSDLVRIITFGAVNLGKLDYVGQKKTPTKTNPDKVKTDSDAGKAFGIAPVGVPPSISLTGASSAGVAVGGGQIVAAEVQLNAANIFAGSTTRFDQSVGVFDKAAKISLAAAQLFASGARSSRGDTYGDLAL